MRLILHAGTHKTGTTSIQKVLSDNRKWLLFQGLDYPDGRAAFGITKAPHHLFAHALVGSDPAAMKRASIFVEIARRSAAQGNVVLVSSESIYRHVAGHQRWDQFTAPDYWQRRHSYLASIAELLRDFDIDVLLFFRRRDSFAQSLYGEVTAKGYWHGTFSKFLSDFEPWFDYDRQIITFREVFRNVRVESYDEALRQGLINAFFHSIGLMAPLGSNEVWERRSAPLEPSFESDRERQAFLSRFS